MRRTPIHLYGQMRCVPILKAPFVCNGCEKKSRSNCPYRRQVYTAKKHRQRAKNHTLFRDIVKTGTSFDDFTQESVNLIFSHVNAVKRKQFNGKSAYDMFPFYHYEALTSALGISLVPANEVIQSPKLLSKIFSQ